jgi:hypothetical protein
MAVLQARKLLDITSAFLMNEILFEFPGCIISIGSSPNGFCTCEVIDDSHKSMGKCSSEDLPTAVQEIAQGILPQYSEATEQLD